MSVVKGKVQGDINSKVLVSSSWKDVFPLAEMGKSAVPSGLWEKTGRSSNLNMLSLKCLLDTK